MPNVLQRSAWLRFLFVSWALGFHRSLAGAEPERSAPARDKAGFDNLFTIV